MAFVLDAVIAACWAYLELALREAIPMATLDTELAAAAAAEGTGLIGAPESHLDPPQ